MALAVTSLSNAYAQAQAYSNTAISFAGGSNTIRRHTAFTSNVNIAGDVNIGGNLTASKVLYAYSNVIVYNSSVSTSNLRADTAEFAGSIAVGAPLSKMFPERTYPPVPMTSNTMTVVAAHGSGSYSADGSPASSDAFAAFDADAATSWRVAPGSYRTDTGAYNGEATTIYTADDATHNATGEWLSISLPRPIKLSSYRLSINEPIRAPRSAVLLGSASGTGGWTLLDRFTGLTFAAPGALERLVASDAEVSYVRLVVTDKAPSELDSGVDVSELLLREVRPDAAPVLYSSNGFLSSPGAGLAWSTDEGTGLFRPAAGSVSISTFGRDALRVGPDMDLTVHSNAIVGGNLGVGGIAEPAHRVAIMGDGTAHGNAVAYYSSGADSGPRVGLGYDQTLDGLAVFTNNGGSADDFDGHPVVVQRTTGNVGIGTAAPSTALHVVGTTRVDGDLIVGTGLGLSNLSDYTETALFNTYSTQFNSIENRFDGTLHMNRKQDEIVKEWIKFTRQEGEYEVYDGRIRMVGSGIMLFDVSYRNYILALSCNGVGVGRVNPEATLHVAGNGRVDGFLGANNQIGSNTGALNTTAASFGSAWGQYDSTLPGGREGGFNGWSMPRSAWAAHPEWSNWYALAETSPGGSNFYSRIGNQLFEARKWSWVNEENYPGMAVRYLNNKADQVYGTSSWNGAIISNVRHDSSNVEVLTPLHAGIVLARSWVLQSAVGGITNGWVAHACTSNFELSHMNASTAAPALSVTPDGFVGIRTSCPEFDLDVNGHVRLGGGAHVGSNILLTTASPVQFSNVANGTGPMVESFYNLNAGNGSNDRYGIGHYADGATRVYGSTRNANATVRLGGLLNSGGPMSTFRDVVTIATASNWVTVDGSFVTNSNLTVLNDLVAKTLTGNGVGLSNLNVDNVTSGTLAVTRGGTGVTSSTGTGSVVLSSGGTLTSPVVTGATRIDSNLMFTTASPIQFSNVNPGPMVESVFNLNAGNGSNDRYGLGYYGDVATRVYTSTRNAGATVRLGGLLNSAGSASTFTDVLVVSPSSNSVVIGNSNFTGPGGGMLNVQNPWSSVNSGTARSSFTASDGTSLTIGKHSTIANGEAFVWTTGGALTIGTSNAERLRVAADGAVSLATTSLTVNGTTAETYVNVNTSANNQTAGLKLMESSMWGAGMTFDGLNDKVYFGHYANSTTMTRHMTIRADGTIGINTENPAARLHVAGDARVDGTVSIVAPSSTSYALASPGAWANFGLAGAPGAYSVHATAGDAVVRASGRVHIQSGAGNAAVTVAGTNPSPVPVLTVRDSNVGVQTANPAAALHVAGAARFDSSLTLAATSAYTHRLGNTTLVTANMPYGPTTTFRRYAKIALLSHGSAVLRVTGYLGGHTGGVREGQLVLDVTTGARMARVFGNVRNLLNDGLTGVVICRNATTGDYIVYLSGGNYFRYTLTLETSEVGLGSTIYDLTSASWSADVATFTPDSGYSVVVDTTLISSDSVSADFFQFATGPVTLGSTTLTGGNVGIGLSNPATKLHVAGMARFEGDVSTSNLIVNGDLTANKVIYAFSNVVVYSSEQVNSNLNVLHRITASNVGIGTSTVNAPLQLANSVANRKIVLWETANNDHQFCGLGLQGNECRYQVDTLGGRHAFFAGANAGQSTELMRIEGSGNVGIGTGGGTPAARLHVVGSARVDGFFHTFNGSGPSAVSASNNFGQVDVGVAANNNQFFSGTVAGDAVLRLLNGNQRLMLSTGTGAPAMTLSNGNVGVGTAAPITRLHVVGNSEFDGTVTACNVELCAAMHPPVPIASAAGYTATGSSAYAGNPGFAAASAFDFSDGTFWFSSDLYTPGSGVVYGTAALTTVSGTSYRGEWVQLQLPSARVINSISYMGTGLNQYLVAGSTDGSTWTRVSLVDTDQRIAGGSQWMLNFLGNTTAYVYYRFIVLKAFGNSVQAFAINELRLYEPASSRPALAVSSSLMAFNDGRLVAQNLNVVGTARFDNSLSVNNFLNVNNLIGSNTGAPNTPGFFCTAGDSFQAGLPDGSFTGWISNRSAWTAQPGWSSWYAAATASPGGSNFYNRIGNQLFEARKWQYADEVSFPGMAVRFLNNKPSQVYGTYGSSISNVSGDSSNVEVLTPLHAGIVLARSWTLQSAVGGASNGWVAHACTSNFELAHMNASTAAPALTVTPAGAVGVGTATPQALLDVAGGLNVFGVTRIDSNVLMTTASPIQFSNVINGTGPMVESVYNLNAGNGSNDRYGLGYYGDLATRVYASTRNANATVRLGGLLNSAGGASTFRDVMTIATASNWVTVDGSLIANSNIGVRTANPQAPLHVVGSTRVDGNLMSFTGNALSAVSASNSLCTVDLGAVFSPNEFVTGSVAGDAVVRNNLSTRRILMSAGGAASTMVLSSSNVGIGTLTPNAMLQVAGNISACNIVLTSNTPGTLLVGTPNNIDVDAVAQISGVASQRAALALFANSTLSHQHLTLNNATNTRIASLGTIGNVMNVMTTQSTNAAVNFMNSAGTSRLYVDTSSGSVGVGKTNPDHRFQVGGTTESLAMGLSNTYAMLDIAIAGSASQFSSTAQQGDGVIRVNATGKRLHLQTGTLAAAMTISENNWVGIGKSNPAYPLDVRTTSPNAIGISCDGDIQSLSDRRVKHDLKRIEGAVGKLMELNGYTYSKEVTDVYTGKKTKSRRLAGVVAQEVHAVLPEVVAETPDGMLTVSYGNMMALMVEAIKEIKTTLDQVCAKVSI
jgi:hypothetical protein